MGTPSESSDDSAQLLDTNNKQDRILLLLFTDYPNPIQNIAVKRVQDFDNSITYKCPTFLERYTVSHPIFLKRFGGITQDDLLEHPLHEIFTHVDNRVVNINSSLSRKEYALAGEEARKLLEFLRNTGKKYTPSN